MVSRLIDFQFNGPLVMELSRVMFLVLCCIRRRDKGNLIGYYNMTFDLLQKVNIPSDIDVQCDGFRCTH